MISVCIITFNGAQYIIEQLQSILCQLSPSDEIIISDDGSSDNTIDKIQALNDNRIHIFLNPKTNNPYHGVFRKMYAINRNAENALKHAKGDYIFLADQDDIWLPNKVNVVINKLQTYNCIIHNCKVINANKKIIHNSLFNLMHPHPTLIGTIYKSAFMGCCMAFTKQVLNKALPFPQCPIEHDTWIGLCALKTGKVTTIQEPLILYRRHQNNASTCSQKSNNSIWIKIIRRLYILKVHLTH